MTVGFTVRAVLGYVLDVVCDCTTCCISIDLGYDQISVLVCMS